MYLHVIKFGRKDGIPIMVYVYPAKPFNCYIKIALRKTLLYLINDSKWQIFARLFLCCILLTSIQLSFVKKNRADAFVISTLLSIVFF